MSSPTHYEIKAFWPLPQANIPKTWVVLRRRQNLGLRLEDVIGPFGSLKSAERWVAAKDEDAAV